MKSNNEKGITLIALIVTVTVMLIILGVSLGKIRGDEGIIKETKKSVSNVERESIIQKIQADLYNEKVKKNKTPTKEELKEIIQRNNYSQSITEEEFVTVDGKYTIEYNEIIGWEQEN